MGVWRSFKGWIERSLLRMVMRVVRTRVYRFARKIARASIVPLSIIAGAAAVGAGVASGVAFPLAYGTLIGTGAGVVAVVSMQFWLRYAEAERARRGKLTTFSVLTRKVSTNEPRCFIIGEAHFLTELELIVKLTKIYRLIRLSSKVLRLTISL